MRRLLLSMLMVVAAATLSLKAQTIVIDDGFENGIQDSIWTQEFVVGQTAWAVEEDDGNLLYPASIWQGKKRAYLRNTTGETQGYVTRLVSKVMDLSPEKVYQPELTFWYANPKWTADRDTLRVLYKTSEKGNWRQLAEFSTASADWQKVRLELPEVNATYQIAFEGTDNLGRGIVLDSVKLRSAPQCTVPHDITIAHQGNGKVAIGWLASWDALTYDLIITKDVKISPDTIYNVPDSLVALRTSVDGLSQHYEAMLVSGAYYYIYLRSVCENESSMWNSEDPEQSGHFRFRVKATKNVPYSYGFDMPYEPGVVRRDLEWTWGGNTGHFNPFINVYQNDEERVPYSPNGTSCVIFTGNNNVTTPIPAGKYAYVATPALADTLNEDFALNQCIVRFWTTIYQNTGRKYAHSLTVGVMTDPEDITTFVPIDTVSVWGTSTFQENIVDLSSYDGEANYVAFISSFDTQNIIYLDDVNIEYKSSVQKPTEIRVNPRDTYADIAWKGNAPSYNVLITNEDVDPATATAAQIVNQETVTTNSYKCEGLEADHGWNRPYYVYVQAVDGEKTSAWSYRYPFVTIAAKKDIPYSVDFEITAGTYNIGDNASVEYPYSIGIFSNDPEYPHIVSSNPYAGSSCLNLTKDWGNDSWITLPQTDSLKGLQVKFYLSGNTTPTQASATIGVMTNPMDINTFIPVSECKVASSGYTLCYANFDNYDGPFGVIAIVWSDVDGGKQTVNYLDNVTVEEVQKCLPPVNIQTEAESDSVTISWDKSDAGMWELVLASEQLTTKQLKESMDSISRMENVYFADTLIWNELTDPTFGINGLDYNITYYMYVRTLCGDEQTWWMESSFKTPCPNDFPIPFFDDFEDYESVNLTIGCWTVRNQGASTYPKVASLTLGDSKKAVDLYSTSSGSSYMALPGVAGDLSAMQLSFDVRTWGSTVSAEPKAYLIVGSMANFEDPTTFIGIDTFYLCGSATYSNIRMDLADYNLPYDNIVFTSGLPDFASRLPAGISFTTSDVALDNVLLKPNTCIDAWGFEATDIQTNSIDIKWNGKATNDEWKIKVTKGSTVVVPDSTIIGKTFHAEGLDAITQYTFYVQASCDTTWSEASFRTGCIKLDPTKPNKETFESYPSGTSYKEEQQAPCWTVGNGNPAAATTYIPYIYKASSTYASSGTNTYRLYPTATYSPTWVAAPEIECESMTELMVTFSFYGGTTYYILPGVMTDPEDLSTFVVLDSIKGQAKIATISMDLSEFADVIPANAKYFAWRTAYNAGPTIYLDDVSIIKVSCPLPKPSFYGLKSDQVSVSSGLAKGKEWIILVTDEYVSPDSLMTEGYVVPDTIVVYTDTLNVPEDLVADLKEQTDYYVAIASLCEDGISPWQTFSFKTPCKAVTPEAMGTITFSKDEGYVTGSGKELPCWTTGNKTNSSATYIPYVGTTTSYMHNSLNYLYIYSYVPSSGTGTSYDGAYAIMPEMDVDDISKYQVNFWARTTSSTTAAYLDELIVGVITDPSDLNTFVVVDTVKLSHSAYEPFTVSFEDYQGDYLGHQGRYIMFMTETGATPGTLAYGYAYVSEISVEKIPTCRPVTEFIIDSIAEDLAIISWKQYSSSYRMMMADKEVKDSEKDTYDEWLIDKDVTNTEGILLDNLEPNTHYYVYAQALCDGGDSSAISMAYAHILTDCPVVNGFSVPYYTDFDHNSATGTGNKPDCWTGVYLTYDTVGTTQSYPYVYSGTSYAASGSYSLYMYSYFASSSNTKTIAVAPYVAGNLNDYMVSFYARNGGTTTSYGKILRLGYVTDFTQHGMDSTFVKIADVEVSATKAPYQVIISDYTTSIPAGARLALRADHSIQGLTGTSGYGTMYIDNFKIGMPPSCFPPTLEPGNTSLTTADVNIIPAKEGNDHWQLAVVPDSIYSDADYDAAKYLAGDKVRIVDADSANFVISGLTAGTKYWLYGRTVCGGDDGNSSWADLAVATRTKYYFKDGYYFGFGKDEDWEFCQGSTSTTYWINPAIEVGYNGGTATTSYTSYYPYQMGNTTSSIYAYGPREAENPTNAALRWYATSSYWGGYAVFPGVVEAHDRSFEFKMRCGYGSYNSTYDTISISTNYACEVEIGTIDKNKGFETYQVIATIFKEALPKVKLTAENDWLWSHITLDLDSATVADKQMVIRLPKSPDSNSRYLHFDDVTLGAPKGFGLVTLSQIMVEPNQAIVTWDSLGGPWNLVIKNANGTTFASYENISGTTSQIVTGLSPQTSYTAVLSAANAPADTKFQVSASKDFRTPCLAIDPDENGEFSWNFNNQAEWEQSDILVKDNANNKYYFKPECFTVGTTYGGEQTTSTVYYNWLIQRKGFTYAGAPVSESTGASSTARYEYGRHDSPALRLYGSNTYMTPYLVLPQLNCDMDTMMIEFWMRCFANYGADYGTASSRNKILSATYLGSSYCQSLVVGTLNDPYDFSSLEVIDTVTYKQTSLTTSNLVSDDPTGNRYWEKMQLPLAGAKGKYIVLFPTKQCMIFVDDLSVKAVGDNLFAPSGAQTGAVTTTTAEFSWRVKHPAIQNVVVVLDQSGDQEIIRDTVAGDVLNYTATGLNPNSAYQWYMYQTNGTVNTETTPRLMFYTECVAITPDYTTGFEASEGWRILPAQTTATYKQNLCWTYENAGTSAVSTYTYNYVNGTSAYSHAGDYALRLYAYSTTYQTYAAMPAMDISAYDTLQVNFWIRPAYATASTGKISTQYTLGSTAATKEYYYSKAVIVGTMTDPNDATTFVPLDTVNYNGTISTSDYATDANDFLFQPKKVALTGATGPYVAFMATLWAKGAENKSTYDYIWVDDITFSAIQHCETPEEQTVSNIGATSATLSWEAPEGAEKYVLQVSTDYTYTADTAFVFNDTVYTNSHVVTGMEAYTEYVWRVRTICAGDLGESEFTQNATFTTARQPFYFENFGTTDLDPDWSFGTNPALTVVDSTDVEITGTNSTSYGFHRVTTDYGLSGAHYATQFYSSSTTTSYDYDTYWMISPTISLAENQNAQLSLDMALSGASISTPNGTAVTEEKMANDFAFMIIISDDGGKTWKKENILGLWCNGLPAILPVMHALRDMPQRATNMRFDLSKYAGKNIRVAFYREAQTYLSATCAVHLDNIRINYFAKLEDSATACQYEDIEKLGFFIDGDKAQAGDTTYMRFDNADNFNAANKGYLDTIYALNVEYLEAPETIFADTICEGESYTDVNFTGKTHTGIYRRKVQSVLHCDSIITLHLFVAPKQESYEFDTICFGGTYTWNGQEYNQTGSYEYHLNTMYGCDSTAHLSLYVRDQITGIQNQSICYGASYSWNGQVYDKTGEYKQTLKSVTGCDSIAILRLEVTDLLFGEPQKETVCHGLTFTWYNGKVYDTGGIYYDTIQSVFGCDSVNTLELTIAPIIQGTPVEVTICSGATYTWNGKTYAKAGTYTEELVSEAGCDSIATLILKVADILIGEPQKQSICEGASYIWNNKLYNVAGTYIDTIQSAGGCDSVATLVLSISSVLHGDPENISICENDELNWNGKIYKNPGTYVDTLTASYGCDSIATLVLTYFGEEDTIRTESLIALADLPFTYENAEHPYAAGQAPIYYAEGTQIGVYSDTVLVEGKNCTAVMIHTLTLVEKLEGVDNVSAGDFSLLPNIINAGETVTARGNFNGMVHIQVYDIVGRLIKDEQKDAATAITINAFPQSGIYTVRISDSTDAHYVGRVMAK